MSVEALLAEMTKPPTVLVIDDEYVVRHMFARLAEAYDIDLDAVSTPLEGMEAVAKKQYSAVFLDMKFENSDSDLTGMDVLRKISLTTTLTAQIVVMSASIRLNDVMQEANRLGVLSFMVKPIDFTPDFLASIMKRMGLRLVPRQPTSP